MPNIRLLSLVTIFVILVVAAAIYHLPPNDLSGYGSIASAGGSMLAVIWFSGSLWYQSTQLKEQRAQFQAQFRHLQEASRRDSLMLAKSILERAEEKAIAIHGGIKSIDELFPLYMQFHELKPLIESIDPAVVQDAYSSWIKKEGAATAFVKGIKSAASVYLQSIEANNIDYTKSPEEFVYIYGCWFWGQPFFEGYQGPANLLCDWMIRLEPGRKAAQLAAIVSGGKMFGLQFLKIDKVREDIQEHREKNYPVPKIAEDI